MAVLALVVVFALTMSSRIVMEQNTKGSNERTIILETNAESQGYSAPLSAVTGF